MKKELSSQHFATDNDVLPQTFCHNNILPQIMTDNDVIDAVEVYFEDQDSSFYEEGIRKLHDRWNKCVNLQGDYVENKCINLTWEFFLRFRPRIF